MDMLLISLACFVAGLLSGEVHGYLKRRAAEIRHRRMKAQIERADIFMRELHMLLDHAEKSRLNGAALKSTGDLQASHRQRASSVAADPKPADQGKAPNRYSAIAPTAHGTRQDRGLPDNSMTSTLPLHSSLYASDPTTSYSSSDSCSSSDSGSSSSGCD